MVGQTLHAILHGGLHTRHRHQAALEAAFGNMVQWDWQVTRSSGHARELAANTPPDTPVLVAGGDGLVNEVLNGCMDRGGEVPRLLIWPCGSGNDYARGWGLSQDPSDLARAWQEQRWASADLMHCSFLSPDGHPIERWSDNITDVGMGGEVAERMHRMGKWAGAFLSYQLAIVHALLRYRNRRVMVDLDGQRWEGPIKSLVMAQGRYFGSGLGIAPHAAHDDGHLAVVRLGDISTWDYVRHLGQVRRCEAIEHPEVDYHRGQVLEVRGTGQELPIDMDGEYVGHTPLRVRVYPAKLNLLLSRPWSA